MDPLPDGEVAVELAVSADRLRANRLRPVFVLLADPRYLVDELLAVGDSV